MASLSRDIVSCLTQSRANPSSHDRKSHPHSHLCLIPSIVPHAFLNCHHTALHPLSALTASALSLFDTLSAVGLTVGTREAAKQGSRGARVVKVLVGGEPHTTEAGLFVLIG